MATFYAWSDIKAGTLEEPVFIARGAKVLKADLGITDAGWQQLVDAGSIRPKQYPAPAEFEGSAIDYLRLQLQEAQAVSPVDEEEALNALDDIQPKTPDEQKKPAAAASTAKDS